MASFSTDGTITNPNNPRPDRRTSPFSAHSKENEPKVELGALAGRNQRFFAIGEPGGAYPASLLNLANHHVIGWDILWGFWNALAARGQVRLMRLQLATAGVPQATTSKMESQIAKGAFEAGDDWAARLCWNPINIVRGPDDRCDDPNDEATMRDKIDFQAAPAEAYGGRLAALVRAGRQMCDYIDTGSEHTGEAALRYLYSIRHQAIMEWNEALWIVDSKSPKYHQVGHSKATWPQWRIYKKGDLG